ncbi:hypothetical protein protein, putative [Babesia ovis]|uniref:Polycystin cation channel PKD1/PKD2 domain-containing protein n=1 Tax=Babesia ovis TaxID=5869 RepID=A0A9W5T8Q2_BABOV|nr:hypothetical protein protein, putative [Babesia ovis]
MVTYNFGRVIDSYVSALFPPVRSSTAVEEDIKEEVEEEDTNDIPRWHCVLQCIQSALLIIALIALSTYALHVRSSYLSTIVQREALKDPLGLTDVGYRKFFAKLDELNKSAAIAAGTVKHFDLPLENGVDTFGFGDIKSRSDVASWLQFGLIPTLYKGLKTYNRLVANTVRLSFVYEGDEGNTAAVNQPSDVVEKPKLSAVYPMELGQTDLDDDADDDDSTQLLFNDSSEVVEIVQGQVAKVPDKPDVPKEKKVDLLTYTKSPYITKLLFASDGTHHTDSHSGGRFMYINGETLDAAMSMLNMGLDYSADSPYYPLNSIISDIRTTTATLEAFTSNPHDYTITYLRASFRFIPSPDGEMTILKTSKASSISTPREGLTRQIQMAIYVIVILISLSYLIHSLIIHRRYNVYNLKVMYVLDALSKLCLLLCILAYTIRLYMGHSSGPYIQVISNSRGDYSSLVTLGRNGRILDSALIEVVFNNLRSTITYGYVSTGLFQIMTFCTITLLFILFCTNLMGGGKVGSVLSFWAFHTFFQFGIAVFGVLFTLCILSFVNAYVVNYVYKHDASFRYNFATLFNILAGVGNSRVESYVNNHGFMHTISIILLLVVFTYFGMIVLLTMMLTANPEKTITSFEVQPLRNPFDSSRWYWIKLEIERRFGYMSMQNRRSILRDLVSRNSEQRSSSRFSYGSQRSNQNVPSVTSDQQRNMASTQEYENAPSLEFNQNDNVPENNDPKKSESAEIDLRQSTSTYPNTASGSLEAIHASLEMSVPNDITESYMVRMSTDMTRAGKPGLPPYLNALNLRLPRNFKFKTDHRSLRMLSYWIIIIGILLFAYKDRQYHSVRKLIQQSLEKTVKTSNSMYPSFFEHIDAPPTPKSPVSPDAGGPHKRSPSPLALDTEAVKKRTEQINSMLESKVAKASVGTSVFNFLSGSSDNIDSNVLPQNSKEAIPPLSETVQLFAVVPAASSAHNAENSPPKASAIPPGSLAHPSPSPLVNRHNALGDVLSLDKVKRIEPNVSFPPRRIMSRQEVFHWMTNGGLAAIFRWTRFDNDMLHSATENPEFMSFNGRFFAVPANYPLLVEIKLRSSEGMQSPIFHNMQHDMDTNTARLVVHSSSASLGLREVFGQDARDFPDVVKCVYIHLLLVDPNAQSKLYTATIPFEMRRSGMVVSRLRVRSVLGVHLSSSYWNIVFMVVTIVSSILFLLFIWWFCQDFSIFFTSYCFHHRIQKTGKFWHCLMVYFVNDYLRFLDLLVLMLIGVTCILYFGIYSNTNTIYSNVNLISTLQGRMTVQQSLKTIRLLHGSLWGVLGLMAFLIVIVQVPLFQIIVQILLFCLSVAFALYLLVLVALVIIACSFFFVILIFAAELYDDLSNDEGFVKAGLRMLIGESKVPSHVFETNPVIMLAFPLCMLMKLFVTNILFTYLWSIWPKNDEDEDSAALEKTHEMFKCESIESYEVSDEATNLTEVAPDQLEMLPDDLKAYCADEAIRLNDLFRQFIEEIENSGMSNFEYLQNLHERMSKETHELMTKCDTLELQLEVSLKTCDLAENQMDGNMESTISLMEATLSDKKNELESMYAKYKSLMEANERKNHPRGG